MELIRVHGIDQSSPDEKMKPKRIKIFVEHFALSVVPIAYLSAIFQHFAET